MPHREPEQVETGGLKLHPIPSEPETEKFSQ